MRRRVLHRTGGLVALLLIFAILVPRTGAAPAPADGTIRSITREDAAKAIFQAFPATPPTHKGGRLRVGITGDIATTNPLLASDGITSDVLSLIFEPLVGLSPVDGQPIPGLADAWEIAADGVT